MNKILKKLIVTMIALSCTFTMCIPVLAGDPGLNGYNYVISTKASSPRISFSHVAVNNTASPDSVAFSVSRTRSFTGSLSGTYEANALVYKVAITAEVGFGVTNTVNTTCTWSVPAYSNITCRYGSIAVDTTGNMERWVNGVLSSSRYVSSGYTYGSYSDKYYN